MSIMPKINRQNRQKHVAILLETSNEYARGVLNGAKKFLRENTRWSVLLRLQERDNVDLTGLSNWEGDGIFARIESKEMADFVKMKNIPTVDLGAFRMLENVPRFEVNDRSFAKLAAEHLISKGFKYFGFCGNSKYIWSNRRYEAFNELTTSAGECFFFDIHAHKEQSLEERVAIEEWLKILPKPIGILACYDRIGLQLLEACRDAKIAVPESVAVLGIDNDELICEISTPALTSVIPNTIKTGYEAASLLDRMMNGEVITKYEYLHEPLGIQVRQSTDVFVTNDEVIAKALHFIRNNACSGISVSDVIATTPLSRRAFEKRFFKIARKTPHAEILEVKMNFVKRLLEETELSLEEIANRSGFAHPEYLSVAFKREISVTPSEYRKFSR